MATTVEATRLTEAHRVAQGRLGAQTVAQMLDIWSLLNPEAVDATFPRWLAAALRVVQGQRITSARLAANYLTTFRALEMGLIDGAPLVLAEAISVEAVQTSLLVTGPVSIKAAMTRGVPITQAALTAQAASAAAAMRHATNGGRDTIHESVTRDSKAIGYRRATSGTPCAFCSMLAGRGAVYRTAETAGEGRKYHDGCHCVPEPVYAA